MQARLLVIGTPRSGTRWLAIALRSVGLRVGHERLMRDGMVSGLHVVDDFYYVNQVTPGTREAKYDKRFLLLRDPRDVIPSIAKALRVDFWHWQETHTGIRGDLEPKLLRAMLFWHDWMRMCLDENPEWAFSIEQIEHAWPEMMARLYMPDTPMPAVDRARFTSGAERLTWEDMKAIQPEVAEDVRKLAAEVGYG